MRSLAVISLNSLVGFFKYLGVLDAADLHVNWNTVGLFIAVGVVGALKMVHEWCTIPQAALNLTFASSVRF